MAALNSSSQEAIQRTENEQSPSQFSALNENQREGTYRITIPDTSTSTSTSTSLTNGLLILLYLLLLLVFGGLGYFSFSTVTTPQDMSTNSSSSPLPTTDLVLQPNGKSEEREFLRRAVVKEIQLLASRSNLTSKTTATSSIPSPSPSPSINFDR